MTITFTILSFFSYCPAFFFPGPISLVISLLFKYDQAIYMARNLRPIPSMLISWDGYQNCFCVAPADLTFHSNGLHHIHQCVQPLCH